MQAQKTLTVEIESSDGNVKIVFNNPRANKKLKFYSDFEKAQKGNAEDLTELYRLVLSDVLEVEGLQWDTGEAITTDEVKNLDIPLSIMNGILNAYMKADAAGERDPKKEVKSDDSLIV